MSHTIAEGPWLSSGQPTLFINFCLMLKKIVGNQIQKQTQNIEYGEVNLQIKKACLCTQRSGSNLTYDIWYGHKNV